MRGSYEKQATMLCIVSPEQRVPDIHPLRRIKIMADKELAQLSKIFEKMYSSTGRPSIPPERILKSMLLIALYSIRSERQFCEQLDYNLLFRWFLDMDILEDSFDHSVFTKNRERLMEHEVGSIFFDLIVRQARESGLMSDDHFTVDGTLIDAWASLKSFRPNGENPSDCPADGDKSNPMVDFHGEKRSNMTHSSTTDPESRLMRKSKGDKARLSYGLHAMMENRNGLLVDVMVTRADRSSEWEACEDMLKRQKKKYIKPKTLGGDKGYDTRDFVNMLKNRNPTFNLEVQQKRKRLQ